MMSAWVTSDRFWWLFNNEQLPRSHVASVHHQATFFNCHFHELSTAAVPDDDLLGSGPNQRTKQTTIVFRIMTCSQLSLTVSKPLTDNKAVVGNLFLWQMIAHFLLGSKKKTDDGNLLPYLPFIRIGMLNLQNGLNNFKDSLYFIETLEEHCVQKSVLYSCLSAVICLLHQNRIWNKWKIKLILLLCAFPYLGNEAMSYLKSLGWMEGQKEIGESCRGKNFSVSLSCPRHVVIPNSFM